MIYKTTSLQPVIARVIRTARLSDMTYANDIIDWIQEGINRMLIRWRLPKTYKCISIVSHKGTLPCELVSLDAVIYANRRLRKGTTTIDPRITKWRDVASNIDSYFVTDTTIQPADLNSQNISLLRGLNIKELDQTTDTEQFYDLSFDNITTSFETGEITICYKYYPRDKDGYPAIPDIEEVRAALFWYICEQLCITGYVFPNPAMTLEYCEKRALKFFRQAKNIIKEQSEDEKESELQLLNNLIPPANYYATFFVGGEQRKYVNK